MPEPIKKPVAKKASAKQAAADAEAADTSARKVHLLVVRNPAGDVINMEAFTGENIARRELDNRIDDGWRYLSLTPGEPYRPVVAEVQP